MRCFVCLPVASVADRLAALRTALAGARPVPPHDLHLTLRFLGEQDVPHVAKLLAGLSFAPIPLRATRLGTFVGEGGDVVAWLGVGADPELLAARAACAEALRPLSLRPDRRTFRPHLTLARGRAGFDPGPFLASRVPDLAVTVDRIALVTSVLTPAAPVYEEVASFPARRADRPPGRS